MTTRKEFEQTVNAVTRKLIDDGKLVEAGFTIFAHTFLKEASTHQMIDMQFAFMAGAQHMFGSIMAMLDPDDEPTEADLRRLDMINKEMDRWIKIFAARGYDIRGTA